MDELHFTRIYLALETQRRLTRVQAYEARVKEVNDKLHAVTLLNPDALSIAAELDAERKKGKIRG